MYMYVTLGEEESEKFCIVQFQNYTFDLSLICHRIRTYTCIYVVIHMYMYIVLALVQ